MNVASLELCKELYELSGWELDEKGLYLGKWWWSLDGVVQDWAADRYKLMPDQVVAPAYDLGYLVRKIELAIGYRKALSRLAEVMQINGLEYEDAACKLAIELFKRGVISKVIK